MRHFFRYLLLIFLFIFSLESTITVTNTNDSGAGSLREAVATANTTPDTIEFDSSLSGQTITLSSSLNITSAYTIDGGSNNLTIETTGNYRVFFIDHSGTSTLYDLSLQNGVSLGGKAWKGEFTYLGGGGLGAGGAIFVKEGNLIIKGISISNCSVYGGDGVNNSVIVLNQGGGGGGGYGYWKWWLSS